MKTALSQSEIVASLRRQLAGWEDKQRARFSGGLDRILPRGFPRGGLVEYFARGGSGATALALVAARGACREGQSLVVVDRLRQFHPLAAESFIVGASTLLIHPSNLKDELWAIHQSLDCRDVGAVVCWPRRLDDRVFRSLQLAAERGGAVGLFIRPLDARGQPSWADIQLLVEAVPSVAASGGVGASGMALESGGDVARRLRVRLLRCRSGNAVKTMDGVSAEGASMEVELNDEAGTLKESSAVHMVAKLAHSATWRRASRA